MLGARHVGGATVDPVDAAGELVRPHGRAVRAGQSSGGLAELALDRPDVGEGVLEDPGELFVRPEW